MSPVMSSRSRCPGEDVEQASSSGNRYRLSELDDTRIVRTVYRGEDPGIRWHVRCPCLYSAGPFLTIDAADMVFRFHKEMCQWPR